MTTVKYTLALSAMIMLAACSGSGAETTAQAYWQALIDGDKATIDGLIDGPAFTELSRWVEPGAESSVRIGETEVDGGGATVDTELTWVDDQGEQATFGLKTYLIKIDGEWKIIAGQTRQAFFASVYRSKLDDIGKALEENIQAFSDLGSEMAAEMASEMDQLSRDLQQQSEEAGAELKAFLEDLDDETRARLEKLLE